MNPDVAAAVERLRADGVLAPDQATLFGAVARGERVSVRAELQLLLYGGVLLTSPRAWASSSARTSIAWDR